MLAFFGFGTSNSDDTEAPAPAPSMLDALLGTPTKPADEVDRLAALHDKFREDLASAPLDDLRKAANEAASLSANDRAAGGWRLDAAARLRAEPEVQTRDESETYGGFSPFSPPREAWRAYASPLNDSPGALRRDSPTSKARVTPVDGKRWGELRVFPGDDAQTPSRWRVSNADADGFDEVGADSAFYWNFNLERSPRRRPPRRRRRGRVRVHASREGSFATASVPHRRPAARARGHAQELHRAFFGRFPVDGGRS